VNISLGNAVSSSGLSLNGGYSYRIQKDRIIVTIDHIQSNRAYDNLSGTLCLAVQAFSFNDAPSSALTLASITLGELKGQHSLLNCAYDLIFHEPPAGIWKFALVLCEWNGTDYSVCDTAFFNEPYCVEVAPEKKNTGNEAKGHSPQTELKNRQPKPQKKPITLSDSDTNNLKKLNRVKLERLAKIKGIPLAVAERLVAQRPFHSIKAILSVKGVGPKTLHNIFDALNN
jgi:hypothetical protein